MENLTPRQFECLLIIADGVGSTHPPTIREIGSRMGGMTPKGAYDHRNTLARKGYLVSPLERRARWFDLTDKAREFIGTHGLVSILEAGGVRIYRRVELV